MTDTKTTPAAERVRLANGEAVQGLIAGVGPVDQAQRDMAALRARRAARRGCAAPPAGGLFDTVARDQLSLF